MFTLRNTDNIFAPVVIGTYPGEAAALLEITERGYQIIMAEPDADHPGCIDVAAMRGMDLSLFTIEPTKGGEQ